MDESIVFCEISKAISHRKFEKHGLQANEARFDSDPWKQP
jgi:hypothetical protein